MKKGTLFLLSIAGSFTGTILASIIINGKADTIVRSAKNIVNTVTDSICTIINGAKRKM